MIKENGRRAEARSEVYLLRYWLCFAALDLACLFFSVFFFDKVCLLTFNIDFTAQEKKKCFGVFAGELGQTVSKQAVLQL